jgi:hypothetical protein
MHVVSMSSSSSTQQQLGRRQLASAAISMVKSSNSVGGNFNGEEQQ